jgi:hypothetical protein
VASPSTREPPRVTETHASPRPPVVTRSEPPTAGKDVCRVAFWNLSSRDLVLTIDGESRTLAQGKSLNLQLKREFVWRIVGSEAQLERIPANKATLDILIRR